MTQDLELMNNLLPQEVADETSDLIFASPTLKQKDQKLAKNILDINLKDFKKRKKNVYFKKTEEKDFINDIEYAIKAILGHEVKKREVV